MTVAWNLVYTLTNGVGSLGPRYITADFTGVHPVLFATSNDQTLDNNRLIRIDDAGGDSAGVTLAFAGANETFRGVHFGPVASAPAAPQLYVQRGGDSLILYWTGDFILQSAENAAGPYSDAPGATGSPYTNSFSDGSQRFFRLRN